MIVDSTPGSITYQSPTGHQVVFDGEWTLEPKFYLSVPKNIFWLSPHEKKELSADEVNNCIHGLLEDAKNKGWIIVIENSENPSELNCKTPR
jgi:hypothetical protein